ncbi:MAG: sensor histidine kinase [Pseudomonadales bacterium]|nr:sensor histidine kinase [Pseudomonadales bacterium]
MAPTDVVAQVVALAADRQSLAECLAYQLEEPPFPDWPGERLQARQTPEMALRGQFLPVRGESVNFGYTDKRVWLRCTVQNTSPVAQARFLLTGQRYMRPLIFYEVHGQDVREVFYNDQFRPFTDRPVALPELVLPLTFEPGESKTLLIYLGAGGALAVDLALDRQENVHSENLLSLLSTVFVTGIILSLVIINLVHYFAVGRIAHLVYALLQTTVGIYLIHMEGFGFQYLWPDAVTFNLLGTQILGHGANLFGSLFCISYLGLRQHHQRLLFLPLGYALISGVCLLLVPFAEARVLNEIGTTLTSTGPILYTGIGLYAYLRGNKSALFFVLGWLALGICTFLFGATVIGWLQLPIVSVDWLRLGTLSEALLLSLGLSDQFRRLNDGYATAQQQLVASLEQRLAEARERIRLEEENLERAHAVAEMDRRLATASHDIGQPIYALRLALLALRRKTTDDSTFRQLDKTLDEMEMLLQENLSGDHSLTDDVPATYGDLVASVAAVFRPEADSRGVEIRVADCRLTVPVNQVAPLRRIVQNLIANSLKHSGGSKMLVGIRRDQQGVRIEMLDNGRGMPVSGESSPTAGSGLGLSIIREICADHQWRFDVLNPAGPGAHFSVRISSL